MRGCSAPASPSGMAGLFPLRRILAEMDGVTWIRSDVSHADGKIFCEYEAPNAELIREHARRAGLPADAVREIQLTISPDMFR